MTGAQGCEVQLEGIWPREELPSGQLRSRLTVWNFLIQDPHEATCVPAPGGTHGRDLASWRCPSLPTCLPPGSVARLPAYTSTQASTQQGNGLAAC